MSLKCPHCGKSIPDSIISAHAGKIGGKKTAKRGPEYFRQLQAMRKERKGGRPTKEMETA
jgi:formylmethanofuran dehydrogenase subunit B